MLTQVNEGSRCGVRHHLSEGRCSVELSSSLVSSPSGELDCRINFYSVINNSKNEIYSMNEKYCTIRLVSFSSEFVNSYLFEVQENYLKA